VGEVARLIEDFHPMPGGAGFVALMVQPVPGEPQGALGVVRADGRFARLLDEPVEAVWVGARASIALVVTYPEGRALLTRYAITGGRLVREREIELRGTLDRALESFAIAASDDGHAIVVGCFSGTWAVWDDGAAATVAFSTFGASGSPAVVRLDGETFLARRGTSVYRVKPDRTASQFNQVSPPASEAGAQGAGALAMAVREGADPVVALGSGGASGVRLYGLGLDEGRWRLSAAGRVETPLVSGVTALGFSTDGERLAVASASDVTVYALEGGGAGIVGSPLANTPQGGVGLVRDAGGVLFAANAGGLSAYSTRTGAAVGRVGVSSRIGGLEAMTRACDGDEREVVEVYSATFGTVMSVDPLTLAPLRCGATALPETGRVRAVRSVPGRDERLVLVERAGGGARLHRQTVSALDVRLVGAPLDLPDFTFGCPPQLAGDLRCDVSGQLRVSDDGRRLVVTWLAADAADLEGVRTQGLVASLEAPWEPGLAPRVFSIPSIANVVEVAEGRVVVAGDLGPERASVLAGLDLEAGLRGDVSVVRGPVALPGGVRGGGPVGDGLASGLFWLAKRAITGERNGFFLVDVDRSDATLLPTATAPGGRMAPSPGRGLVGWVETAWGRASSADGRDGRPVWNAVSLGPDGASLRALPSLELPMPLDHSEESLGHPCVTYTSDGARAIVAVPWSDRLARVD
jgi:hypothetical protein